jgi:hypothetical protein
VEESFLTTRHTFVGEREKENGVKNETTESTSVFSVVIFRSFSFSGGIMKPFTLVAAVVFLVIAIFHLLRLTSHWVIMVNSSTVPEWVSIPGFLVASVLAVMLSQEGRKK